MSNPSSYLDNLTRAFSKLPGIGPKSASRLSFHILSMTYNDVEDLCHAIIDLKKNIKSCKICGGISDEDVCSICQDESRDTNTVCVIEGARDVLTIEMTGEYSGVYHVLNGLISPLDGIGPDDLNINSLIEKCKNVNIKEVILAFNPTVEGDATALYSAKLIKPLGVRVTRIAHGLPVGSDLEYADSATIIKSIEGRVDI